MKKTKRTISRKKALAVVPKTSVKIHGEGSAHEMDMQELMSLAIRQKGTVDVIERLVALQNASMASWARKRFFDDLASFQAECPVITKKQLVLEKDSLTKARYRFANFESIIDQTRDLIRKWGFSYSFTSKYQENRVYVTCIVHHRDGHEEKTDVSMPIDKNKWMSDPQQEASTITFAKRYAFNCAFGIVTGDQDMDGNKNQAQAIEERRKSLIPIVESTLIEGGSKWPSDSDDWVQRWIAHARLSLLGPGKNLNTHQHLDSFDQALQNGDFNLDTAEYEPHSK